MKIFGMEELLGLLNDIKKTLISWFSVRDLCRFQTNGKERCKDNIKVE
jgi:flagellar basal body-associated protein FliL